MENKEDGTSLVQIFENTNKDETPSIPNPSIEQIPIGRPFDPQDICSICHDVYKFPVRISSGYIYCQDCINIWWTQQNNTKQCPITRMTEQTITEFLDNNEIEKQKSIEFIKNNKLTVGMKIDAKDFQNNWHFAKIIEIYEILGKIRLHFCKWGINYDILTHCSDHNIDITCQKYNNAKWFHSLQLNDKLEILAHTTPIRTWYIATVIAIRDNAVVIEYRTGPSGKMMYQIAYEIDDFIAKLGTHLRGI